MRSDLVLLSKLPGAPNKMASRNKVAFQFGAGLISGNTSFANCRNGLGRESRLSHPVHVKSRNARQTVVSRQVNNFPDRTTQRGMRPKQSLGQNFLRDRNMVTRIVDAFDAGMTEFCPEAHVVEVGPGLGALTTGLFERHPDMSTIEIDQRAVQYLNENFPGLAVQHGDVLETDWPNLAKEVGSQLAVIGNLPYNIVSQIMFSMLEAPSGTIGVAVVMMQKEVAERIIAKTRTKAYGILSVIGQLYSKPKILFNVPNTVFYPKPDVTSAMVQFTFKADPCLDVRNTTLTSSLRKVVRCAFNQRRKVLRNSVRKLCEENEVELPEHWASKRAEELRPPEFVALTELLFQKELANPDRVAANDRPTPVWR